MHVSYLQAANALRAIVRVCTGSSEHSLLANAISTFIIPHIETPCKTSIDR